MHKIQKCTIRARTEPALKPSTATTTRCKIQNRSNRFEKYTRCPAEPRLGLGSMRCVAPCFGRLPPPLAIASALRVGERFLRERERRFGVGPLANLATGFSRKRWKMLLLGGFENLTQFILQFDN